MSRAFGRTVTVLSCGLCLATGWPARATAQSLGEAARKAREQREASPAKAAPSYTQDDLDAKRDQAERTGATPEPTPTPSATRTPEADAPVVVLSSESMGPQEERPPRVAQSEEQKRARQEAYWRQRLAAAQARVARAEARLAAAARRAQHALNGCGLDARRAHARAEGAVESAQAELDQARQALEDLPDEARQAGALPGWLR